MTLMRRSFRGNRGAALVIEGVAQATAAGMNPNIGQSPDQLSPQLDKTLADKLLTEAKGEIFGVFGILPGLHNPATTGPTRQDYDKVMDYLREKIGSHVKEPMSSGRKRPMLTAPALRITSPRCWSFSANMPLIWAGSRTTRRKAFGAQDPGRAAARASALAGLGGREIPGRGQRAMPSDL